MDRIFILGATGHLGGSTVRHLLQRGAPAERIVAVVRDTGKAAPLERLGVEVRKGDYDDSGFSAEVFRGADRLLLVSSPAMDGVRRIRQHAAVIQAARNAGVRHIVYTGLAYPEAHGTPLKHVHIATEHALRSSGVAHTVLRNAFYMEYFIVKPELERAVGNGALLSAANGQKVNFASREDMALAAAVVLTGGGHEGKVYELTYPEAYSYGDIAAILSKATGRPIAHRNVTAEEMQAYLQAQGLTPQQMQADSSAYQPAFATGWAGQTSDALVNLIGRDRLTTVEAHIRGLFAGAAVPPAGDQ